MTAATIALATLNTAVIRRPGKAKPVEATTRIIRIINGVYLALAIIVESNA
ncbi:Ig domain-containing protein group 1 domain-containing protein [Alicyclobacillus hesperidum URH17-3-68]|nr:Ig domain-containing protein group 1 domain-containing protein [Alicyclobacillus hesperidum URH17-3-68]